MSGAAPTACGRWAAGVRTGAGRIYDEERAEIATVMEPYKWYPQRAGRVDLVMERAKATGRDHRSRWCARRSPSC